MSLNNHDSTIINHTLSLFFLLFITAGLTACGGDSGDTESSDKAQPITLKMLEVYTDFPETSQSNSVPITTANAQLVRTTPNGTVSGLLNTLDQDIQILGFGNILVIFTGIFEPNIVLAVDLNNPLNLQIGDTIPEDVLVRPLTGFYLSIDAVSTAIYRELTSKNTDLNKVPASDLNYLINNIQDLDLPTYTTGTSVAGYIRSVQTAVATYVNAAIDIANSKTGIRTTPEILTSGYTWVGGGNFALEYSTFKLSHAGDIFLSDRFRYFNGQGFNNITSTSVKPFYLGQSGWFAVNGDLILEQYNSDGSVTLSTDGLEKTNMSMDASNLQGKNISQVLASISPSWFNASNINTAFSAGASMLGVSHTHTEDAYYLLSSPLFGTGGIASSLDDLLVSFPLESTRAIQTIDWSYSFIELEMLKDGTANYYSRDVLIATSTYTRESKNGVDLITAIVPDSIPDTATLQGNYRNWLFGEVNGKVYHGTLVKQGSSGYEGMMLNDIALQDIIGSAQLQ